MAATMDYLSIFLQHIIQIYIILFYELCLSIRTTSVPKSLQGTQPENTSKFVPFHVMFPFET